MLKVLYTILILATALSLRADALDDTGVPLLRKVDPTLNGLNVKVAQVEAPEAPGSPPHFEVSPFAVGQPTNLFKWISILGSSTTWTNDKGVVSGHAGGVGGFFYGVGTGVATNVLHVDNYEAGYFESMIVGAIIPPVIPSRVVNQSFINTIYDSSVDQNYDDYAAKNGTLFVNAAGLPSDSIKSPASSYNGITVNAFDTTTPPVGPTPDLRSKPDITADGAGATSFSTPFVAGCATVLYQAAYRGDGGANTNAARDARTIKALLLNGALKPAGWTNGPITPLDARHGAGFVNVFNSWMQLKGGLRPFIESTTVATNTPHPPGANLSNISVLSGYDFNTNSTITTQDRINHYYFNLSASNKYTLTATLVWNKQEGVAGINDLNLYLYRTSDSNLVAASTSAVDNVEHIFLPQLAPGRYDLQVFKHGSGSQVSASEPYALAFEMFNMKLAVSKTNSNAQLSWPLYPAGFRLQYATNLIPPSTWFTASNTVTVNTNTSRNLVQTPFSSTNQFFRLVRP